MKIIEATIAMSKMTKARHGMINEATNCKTASLKATKSKTTAKKMETNTKTKLTIAKIFAKDLMFPFSIFEIEASTSTMNTSVFDLLVPWNCFH